MEKVALLVVDVQEALVSGNPFNEKVIINNIRKLIDTARRNDVEVIYVQHDGGIGDELEKNTKGWEIHSYIQPSNNEKIFDKTYNSAFKETGLREYLNTKGIQTLILVGMQTEYCIDTTCKAAFEYGYSLIIPEDTTTTYDNEFLSSELTTKYYEQKIWNKRFARVITVEEVIEEIMPL